MTFNMATNSYMVGYFDAVTLDQVGKKIELSITYTSPANAFAGVHQALRVGFFDSDGSRVSGNGATTNAAFYEYKGGAATFRVTNTGFSTDNSMYVRTGENNNLWSSGAYTKIDDAATLAPVNTTGTSMLFSIERLPDDQLRYSVSYGANSYTIVETTPETFTFDTFSVFGNPGTEGGSLEFSELSISVIPEPSTFALIAGGLLLGFVLVRRVRR